jgi:hypothetical protein
VSQRPPDRCRCCGYRTGCTTCPVCFWTDDGRAGFRPDDVLDGQNGDLTLRDARLNFAIYGASHPRYQSLVRPPRPEELPPVQGRAAVPEQNRAVPVHGWDATAVIRTTTDYHT